MPTLGVHVGSKNRKPVPRISTYVLCLCGKYSSLTFDPRSSVEDEHDRDRSTLGTFRRMGHSKKSSSRPSTANGPELHEKERVEGALKALEPGPALPPITDESEKGTESEKGKDKDKDKPRKPKDPAVLRKRTSSSTDVTTRSPAAPTTGAGIALKPGKSILEQIGIPEHNGWMRKKSENYNSWKLRYFVLKGPHLYWLKSNDKSVGTSTARYMCQEV
jgi:hypothetical protein